MSRRLRVLACALAALGLAAIGPATAAAQGGSAGNSQYIDPLAGSHHHHHASSSQTSSTTTTTTTSGSSNTLTSSPPSSAGPASKAGSSSPKHDPGHSLARTLPFTGMNVWACALLGITLLSCGLVLRRTIHQTG